MKKGSDPKELAIDLLDRSTCQVQVAAVIFDNYSIHSWGHNHMGFDGMGEHAECAAIRRSNRNRLADSSIAVAGRRKRNAKSVVAFPCAECQARLIKVGILDVWIQDHTSVWIKVRI